MSMTMMEMIMMTIVLRIMSCAILCRKTYMRIYMDKNYLHKMVQDEDEGNDGDDDVNDQYDDEIDDDDVFQMKHGRNHQLKF